ncbi:MAG: hypothetical protein WCL08_07305, partial [Verrucomicrobiota bacterium]
TLVISGTFSTTFAGLIADGNGVVSLNKSGSSTLTLGAQNVNFTNAGNNIFSGGVTLNQGVLQVNNPFALGGGPVLGGQSVPLGTPGAGFASTGDVNLVGGQLNLRSNGGGNDGTIILGNPTTNGVNVNVRGPVTINVDQLTANTGNSFQIGNLTMTENTLTVSGGNNYRLRVAGTTTLSGAYANFVPNGDISGALELAGSITGSGALNRVTTFNQIRLLTISGTSNSYTGGTNVVLGMLQVAGNAGTPLGSGPVKVFPNGVLRIAGASSLGSAPLSVMGRANAMGMVTLDSSFDPSSILTPSTFSSVYGVGLGIGLPFFNTPLNMSAIGDGRAFLVGGVSNVSNGQESAYVASTLVAGSADTLPGATSQPVYRLSSGQYFNQNNSTLVFSGRDNVLTDAGTATFVQVGSPLSNVINSTLLGQYGQVTLRNSNNFAGGLQIAKNNTLQIETGAGPSGQTPMGTSYVEVYGTLQNSGLGSSFVNAVTGQNANTIILRPGATLLLNVVAGVSPAGGQGRFADGGTFDLNGATFSFQGANSALSRETVGTLVASKTSTLTVTKGGTSPSNATLTLNGLTRRAPTGGGVAGMSTGSYSGAGVLQLNTGTVNSLGIPSLAVATSNYTLWERIVLANGTAAAGLTTGGNVYGGTGVISSGTALTAGGLVTTGGIVNPWVIDIKDVTFVGYNVAGGSFGGDTGFQPLLSYSTTPALGQIAFSSNTLGTSTINDTVDISGAQSLASGTTASAYALKTTINISLAAGSVATTLTIKNGGLLMTGGSIGAISSNVRDALTINFGVGGGTEAVIYATGSPFINANITAAGLTKFGSGNLALTGINTLTAPVTLDGGGLFLQNTLDGTTGNALSTNPVGSRAIILNGGQLNVDTGLGSTSLTILPDIGFRRALATLNSDIYVNADASIYGATTANASIGSVGSLTQNGVNTPSNNISLQPLKSLTFADLGDSSGPTGGSMRDGVTLTLNAVYVNGTTALGDHSNNIYTVTGQSYGSVLGGTVTGGLLNKYGPTILLLASGSNSYSKGSVVYGDATAGNSSVLGSLTRTGTPFGTGSITVNPGGLLRLADLSNITTSGSNAVTV